MMLAGGVCVLGDAFAVAGTTRTYELAPSGVGLGTLSDDPVLHIRAQTISDTVLFGLELEIATRPAGAGTAHRQAFRDIELSADAPTWSATIARQRFWTH